MTNKKYIFRVERLTRRKMLNYFKRIRGSQPESEQVPPAAIVDYRKRLEKEDFPFGENDRVQIMAGEHKGKVGQILMRYPNFGNAVYVVGAGGKKVAQAIEQRQGKDDDSWSPMRSPISVHDIKNLRLVTKVRNSDGTEEDVAIHSLELGPHEYDMLSNSWVRERFAKHDKSIKVPFQTKSAEVVEHPRVTTAEDAEARTHYVVSAIEPSVSVVVAQPLIGMHSKKFRERFARAITERDLAKIRVPEMPKPPKTQELLQKLAAMPKRPQVPFTPGVMDHIGEAVKAGLQKRLTQEKANLEQYK